MESSKLDCLNDNLADAFVHGRAANGAEIEAHLDNCPTCREQVSALALLRSQSFAADSAEAPESPGKAVDRYLLLDVIGSGAMGVVYAAYDPQLRRRVALKLLKPGVRRREPRLLAGEARALAQLQHPNVITIYDAAFADGGAFVAMELVEGRTLRAWLAAAPRTRGEIVARFIEAARGLAAAHAVGLVHCDFKPDNVLVGDDGRVRVTDFGLAREVTDGAAPPAGTPAYMAPEQVRQAPSAKSDQFSFCVALYEALCKRRPFDGRTLDELRAQAERGAPRAPLPRRLARALARGLHPDPERRFPSMAALVAALEPARRASLLAVGGLLAVALLIAALAITRAGRERACSGAERELAGVWDPARAEAVRAAFAATGAVYAADAFRAVDAGMRRFAARWSGMYTDACRAARVRGEQSEEILSLRNVCLDRRRRELSALSDLFAHADAALVEKAPQAVSRLSPVEECADLQALSARRRAVPSELRAEADAIQAALVEVRALDDAARYGAALAGAAAAVARARTLGNHATLADALMALANDEARADRPEADRDAAEAAIEAEAAGIDDLKTRALLLQVRVIGRRRFAEAHEALRRAAATIERLGGDTRLRIKLDMSEAQVLESEGRYPEELARLDQAIALQERLPDSEPLEAAQLRTERASALRLAGRAEDSLTEARAALAIKQRVLGPRHTGVAMTAQNMGVALLDLRRPAEALPLLEQAREIWRATTPETVNAAAAHDSIGNALLALERLDEAERSYRQAIALFEKVLGPESAEAAFSLQNLGELRQRQGRLREAGELEAQALAILERKLGATHPDLVYPLVNLSALALAEGKASAAQAWGERALAVSEKALGPEHAYVGRALVAVAKARMARGQRQSAAAQLERAEKLLSRGGDPQLLAEARFALARALSPSPIAPARAVALAGGALDGYRAAGATREAAAVELWLSAHSR